jgi:DNA mismatch repair protein MutS
LGRGTSTYDGLALTQSIITHVATVLWAKTLVATHYHELIALEQQYTAIRNFSVSVYETDKDVVFLKKIVSGWANKSYGLDVAKRAGINADIIDHARALLADMENNSSESATTQSWMSNPWKNWSPSWLRWQIDQPAISPHYAKIKRILDATDINQCTPMQALALLATMKE